MDLQGCQVCKHSAWVNSSSPSDGPPDVVVVLCQNYRVSLSSFHSRFAMVSELVTVTMGSTEST